MGRATLELRLHEAEGLAHRTDQNIVFQRQMIATLHGAAMTLRQQDVPEAAGGYARETRHRQGPIIQGTGEALVGLHWQRPKGATADLDLAKRLSRDLPLRSY